MDIGVYYAFIFGGALQECFELLFLLVGYIFESIRHDAGLFQIVQGAVYRPARSQLMQPVFL